MNEDVPFRINYPLEILNKNKKINFNNKRERETLFRRSLFYYKYNGSKNKILEKRYKIYFLLVSKVMDFITKKYPYLEIFNVSIFGSSLYSKKPKDFDFLVIVKGNVFLLEETRIKLDDKKGSEYSIGISVKGIDNLSFGIFDLKCKTPFNNQAQIINRTSISLYRRHIPLTGYDFIENKEIFMNNIYAQVSDLLSNTYNLYYLKKERLFLTDNQRAKKILSRLYEAVSYLGFLENDFELINLKKEIYLHYNKNTSFSKSKKIFDKFKIFYINKSKGLRISISREISFDRDKNKFQDIFNKTKELLSKKRIGQFLPVMAKIIDNKGKTIAFSKRIKQSKNVNGFQIPIHAEICAINKAKSKNKTNWNDYSLYCSLEPCGACSKIISELGIKKVVYCLADPLLSYYGRKTEYYSNKNILFYKHNTPELIAKFQNVFLRLYKREDIQKKGIKILEVLTNKELRENISERLEDYWKIIGLPWRWINPILKILTKHSQNEDLAINKVRTKFPSITNMDSLDCTRKLVEWREKKVKNLSKKLNKYIVGEIIADIGGRNDDFVKQLISINKSIKNAYITDIDLFSVESKNHKIDFIVQQSNTKLPFIKNSVDTIILSMVLHHLKSTHQKNLIKNAISSLIKNGRIVLIEDSYPISSNPKNLSRNINTFLNFNKDEKQKILSFYDWFGNRLMRNRDETPLFYNYKTMEEWKELFEHFGVRQIKAEFIGDIEPENFCFFPPKAILIFEK